MDNRKNNPQLIKIVAALVTAQNVTIYDSLGISYVYMQGDPLIPILAEEVFPELRVKGEVYFNLNRNACVESKGVCLDEYEKKSGVAKFFSVTKKALASLFGKKTGSDTSVELKEEVIGTITQASNINSLASPEELSELLSEASEVVHLDTPKSIHMTDDEWDKETQKREKADTAVIAVVETDKGVAVIPNADALASQIAHGVKTQNTKGVDKLMQRLAAMTSTSNHSVQDVLAFVEKADLPLTDDGDIIIYKRVNRCPSTTKIEGILLPVAVFKDCHSGNVKQWAGCEVVVDKKLVDLDRKKDCSNGLHVCTRTYLSTFYGSNVMLGLLSPEDILAVPERNVSKVRTYRYRLLDVLDDAAANYVLSRSPSSPMPDSLAVMLNKAIKGLYPKATCKVTIGGHNGGNVTYTSLTTKAATPVDTAEHPQQKCPPIALQVKENVELEAASRSPTEAVKAPKLKVEAVEDAAKKEAKAGKPSNKDEVKALLAGHTPSNLPPASIARIVEIKKRSKKSYEFLGVSPAFVKVLTAATKK
ncbi:MAG: hypothetical protein [Podoviridae sp. ctLUJ1]|nr:MAG: hypothetical protein [Podoviridae sp. ctLUJ1]